MLAPSQSIGRLIILQGLGFFSLSSRFTNLLGCSFIPTEFLSFLCYFLSVLSYPVDLIESGQPCFASLSSCICSF